MPVIPWAIDAWNFAGIFQWRIQEFTDGAPTYYHRPQQSCEGYVFTPVSQSFCSQGGVCQHAMGQTPPPDQRQTPPRTKSRPPGPKSRHPPGPKADTPGTKSRHPPPTKGRRLLLRTVRILLECILQGFHSDWKNWKTWKNGKAFSSQGKVREIWTDGKSQGKPHKILENWGYFQKKIICYFSMIFKWNVHYLLKWIKFSVKK